MNEKQAASVAKVLGGETWQSGGDVWLVLLRRADDRVVAISDDAVCEYRDKGALENGKPVKAIVLH